MTRRFLFLIAVLLWANIDIAIGQEPSIRFIDGTGKTLLQVEVTVQEGITYIPIDAIDALPNLKTQYIGITRRLTIEFRGKKIYLRVGSSSVTLEGTDQTISISEPLKIINRQPMLPVSFFTEVLPQVYSLDVDYTPILQRIRMTERTSSIPGLPALSNGQENEFLLVIDPGHGGVDTGSRGNTGILEKNVVLNLAKQIEALCQQNQIRVLLTRNGDFERRSIERTQIANQNGGKLFLSLHCNSSFSPKMEGIRVYINNSSGRLQSKHQENVINGTPQSGQIKVLSQEAFLEQSRQFALLLQNRLELLADSLVPLTELPLVTLSNVYMPAVLVEIGYLSSEADEVRLADPNSLASMATVIVETIQTYITAANSAGEAVDGR